ncbi:MAG: hypothetical protein LAT68_09465 [Cyclobacteriaceae bacterium]|nr:hypothetical protein [Cyclobacteriaceae bacterium]MCH8516542.1 hypothetical protein [Cyclobacteriaceae bacterium]
MMVLKQLIYFLIAYNIKKGIYVFFIGVGMLTLLGTACSKKPTAVYRPHEWVQHLDYPGVFYTLSCKGALFKGSGLSRWVVDVGNDYPGTMEFTIFLKNQEGRCSERKTEKVLESAYRVFEFVNVNCNCEEDVELYFDRIRIYNP